MPQPTGPTPAELRTDRLVLRRWRDDDRAPFAAMNADPEVMAHFLAPLTTAESDLLVDRIEESFAGLGLGLWAVEVTGGPPFVGFVGLLVPSFSAPFAPAVEVGWRLARSAWGRGYAIEAARASVADGFGRLELDEIVSFTSPRNAASRRVMERLDMQRDPADDFDHPEIPEGHELRRHVLYRLAAPEAA